MKRLAKPIALAAALLVPMQAPRADAIKAFCESQGGTIRAQPGVNGNPVMTCELKDGTSMNAVAFFRNRHRSLK